MMLEHMREKNLPMGMKCAILLNQSTTTMITSNPLDGGKLTMKSMDKLSHCL